MNKLGIQWQRETDAVLEYNRLVQPTVLKSINCLTREFWQQLVGDNPNSIRIYRHYPNYDEWRDEPEQCAANAVHTIMAEIAHIQDLITHIEDNNEWVFPFFSDAEIDAADRYMEAFIKTAWNSFGMRTVFLNSACGHWGDDIVVFHRTLKAAEQYGAILGQHEYDYPTMMRIYEESGDYWLCGKWKKSMAAIKAAGYQGIKCIITEAGIDGGVADKPMKGWCSVPNALENYCASLLWYNDLLIANDDVLGAAIFIMSGEGMWSDFDIEGSEVPNRIAQFPTVPIPEPPEEPNGEVSMIRVFNIDGVELFGEEALDLIAYHGITVREPENMRPNEWYWAVIKLEEREGPACFIYTGLLADGTPAAGQEAAWAWANMGDADDIKGNNYSTDWKKEADLGNLNDDGNMGPGFGQHGWYHDPYKPGPGRAWIRDELRWSVLLTGIGMLGMTEHRTMYATWQLKQWQDGEEPPADGELLEVTKQIYGEVKETRLLVAEIRDFLKDWEFPPEDPDEPEPPEEMFLVEFFNNMNLEGPPVHTMQEAVPFWHNWGLNSPVPGVVNKDYVSARWTGTFSFEAKSYRFNVKTDDGVRLWIDGDLVLDKWFPQGPTLYGVDVPLTAGKHEVKLEWYEQAGGATIHLAWD